MGMYTKKYSGAFILCPVPPGGHPASVTIIADNVPTDFPGDRADSRGITISAELPAEEFRIVACVPPLHRRYDKVSQLIEFVEVQRMLGVDLIVVYNHSVSARVGKVLDSMSHHGVVHVIPWELPFDAYLGGGYTNIHYFGQLAAVNDCLYRYRSRTQYIINVDMDEYIVPSLEGNLWLWVNKQLTLNPAASAFILKSYLLYSYLPDHKDYFPTQEAAKKYQLVTLLKTNRTEETLPFRIRPKYIYDPKRVVSAGIHNIWGHRRNFKSQYIPSDDCTVYHYRNAKVTPNPNGSVTDTYFHSFQYDIVQRIESRWRTIRREMNLTFSDLNH
ncbi:beta-1,4-galactosyltransferase galt-1-like [Liolophura sinensis]|uniref:beta-1,4-galactosyltransferase galt-1-like n=1 Tax=Liolophura sinensis TaxID=3198878 RepID=UPI0031594B44